MNIHYSIAAVLMGLYLSYGVWLGRMYQGIWCRLEQDDRTSLNLMLLVIACMFWPVVMPFCYLELLSNRMPNQACNLSREIPAE